MSALIVGASGYLGSEIFHQATAASIDTVGTYASKESPELARFIIGRTKLEEIGTFDTIVWATNGYEPGAGIQALDEIASTQPRLIYVSSDIVTSEPALKQLGDLGDYARMKRAEEAIARDIGALILRVGPLYGETTGEVLDKRTAKFIDSVDHNTQQPHWTNVYKTFVPVREAAKFIVDNIQSTSSGTYFLGPETRESYFDFYSRMIEKYGLNPDAIRPDILDSEAARRLGISFDTSFSQHADRILLEDNLETQAS